MIIARTCNSVRYKGVINKHIRIYLRIKKIKNILNEHRCDNSLREKL